jgi:hypothetical protein
VVAILIGHTYKIRATDDHFDYAFEAGRIARSLVTGHGYGNPFDGPSGPTAWLAPLYPLLVAGAFKLFGVYSNAAALFVMVVDSVASSLVCPAVYEIGARCFDARGIARRGAKVAAPVGLWAAWLWAVYPAAIQYPVHWMWEMSITVGLFAWMIVLALRLRAGVERAAGVQSGRWFAFGLLWGLIALSNPSLLLMLPVTMIWVGWPVLLAARTRGRELGRAFAGAVLASVIWAAVMMPWWVRNERTMGALVLTRSNFGVELDRSVRWGTEALPWGTSLPRWTGDPDFQEYARMGEVKFAQMHGERGKAWIKEHPGKWLLWSVYRFTYFWDGTPHSPEGHAVREYLRQLQFAFLSVCGVLGLLLALRQKVWGAGLFGLAFLLVPVPYYLLTVQARFRHPLEPMIAVLAVYLFRSADTSRMWSVGPWAKKSLRAEEMKA